MADLRTNYPTAAPFEVAKWNGLDANQHAAAINENTHDIEDLDDEMDSKIPAPAGSVKGDVLAHNGTAWVRLPKGTNGQALIYDSSTATGLRAGTVASSGGAASSAGITVDGDGFWVFDDAAIVGGGTP